MLSMEVAPRLLKTVPEDLLHALSGFLAEYRQRKGPVQKASNALTVSGGETFRLSL
jgi:hypothetical protein